MTGAAYEFLGQSEGAGAARMDGQDLEMGPPAEAAQIELQAFRRKSRKYWVPNEYVPHVIHVARQHLPVHRRGVIHSVYFDTTDKSMYRERLIGAEGARLFRVRWYGDDKPSRVYLEVKTHSEKSCSSKQRVMLGAKQAMALVQGDVSWKRSGPTADDPQHVDFDSMAADARELADMLSTLVDRRALSSSVRSEYYRTAFESSTEDRYRMSLDENVRLVRDTDIHRRSRWSAKHLADSEIHLPFAVFEVKVGNEHLRSGVCDWVDDLLAEGYLLDAAKFSKYLTGCSHFYPQLVPAVPSWMTDGLLRTIAAPAVGKLAPPTSSSRFTLGSSGSSSPPAASGTQGSFASLRADGALLCGWGSSLDAAQETQVVDRTMKATPSIFLANERTFLKWLNICLQLVVLGLALAKFGYAGRGSVLLAIAGFGSLYAAWRHHDRYRRVMNKARDGYHDRFAVPMVTIIFCLALGASVCMLAEGQVMSAAVEPWTPQMLAQTGHMAPPASFGNLTLSEN